MDIGEPVKFRVSGEVFEESSPIGPPSEKPGTSASVVNQENVKTPYRIIGAINESGLGLLSWWNTQTDSGGGGGGGGEGEEAEGEQEEEYEE